MGEGRRDRQLRRADALRNEARILSAARRLLTNNPEATLADIAAAAGVSRSTLYRRFEDRSQLIEAVSRREEDPGIDPGEETLPAGRLGRERRVALDAIHVFDVVPPPALPDQLVAEAERLAKVPVALYVLDIDGTHLLRIAGAPRLGAKLKAPLAIGPELDADGLLRLRHTLQTRGELYPLWLRGRAIGVFVCFGRPAESLVDLARQAAAAITLADRYTDVFAQAQRRKQPKAAAEIQQSLLPPRISRVTGGEVAGNVLPTYEVAGDWFDVIENADGIWITLADGLGDSTRASAASAVALGALRAARRSDADIAEALVVMHGTLRELPGPRAEMTAVVAHWDPATGRLRVANCGHTGPLISRSSGESERLEGGGGHGLGGRATPKPQLLVSSLDSGDRLILVSDGVADSGPGKAGLDLSTLIGSAEDARRGTAAETVRRIHTAVLDAADDLADDATAVCLSVA